jgi:glycolate oxidase iron-sulfur subunit
MIFQIFPYPNRLRLMAGPPEALPALRRRRHAAQGGVMKLLPKRMRAMEALMPMLTEQQELPEVTPAVGEQRRRVGLSRAACSGSSSPTSTPPPCASWPPRAARS